MCDWQAAERYDAVGDGIYGHSACYAPDIDTGTYEDEDDDEVDDDDDDVSDEEDDMTGQRRCHSPAAFSCCSRHTQWHSETSR